MQTGERDYQIIKDNTIELLNTIFIFIVLFLHHAAYTIQYFGFFSLYMIIYLQKLSIGGFFFLSGFKLANSKASDSSVTFIVGRFFRIYPLYLIAVIVFSFTAYPYSHNGEFPSLPNIILHIFCVQSIVPDMFQAGYATLWFVSMLFCCYIFFLLTRKILQRTPTFFLCLFLTSFGFFVLHKLGKQFSIVIFDRYLVIYLTFFALGMIYSHSRNQIKEVNNRFLYCLFITGFIGLILFYKAISIRFWYESTAEFFFILVSTIPLYVLAFKVTPQLMLPSIVNSFVSGVSYSSFCVFLFHRSIWSEMSNIWNEKSFYQWLFIIVLGIPIIFLLCYLTQSTYDRVIRNVRRNDTTVSPAPGRKNGTSSKYSI